MCNLEKFNISDRLKKILEEKKMTVYRLSKNSGVSQSGLNEIVMGKKKYPRIDTIIKIANGLNMSIDELVKNEV